MEKENTKQNNLLGIFDSGVGGFSVYKKIKDVTSANVVYYGDCARAPYGNREEHEIAAFIKDDIRFLQDEEVTHFVNACNSMSVITTNELLRECGVQEDHYTDMVRAFDKHTLFGHDDKVLVMATQATIRSGIYQEVLSKKGVEVFEYVFTDLARALEQNAQEDELLAIIEPGMLYAQKVGATHVIYGCTHYPLAEEIFRSVKNNIKWDGVFIDPAVYVAEEVRGWNLTGEKKLSPHSSKDTSAFIKNMIQFL